MAILSVSIYLSARRRQRRSWKPFGRRSHSADMGGGQAEGGGWYGHERGRKLIPTSKVTALQRKKGIPLDFYFLFLQLLQNFFFRKDQDRVQ